MSVSIRKIIKSHFDKSRTRCYELCGRYYPEPWKKPINCFEKEIKKYSRPSFTLLNAGCGKSDEHIIYKSLCAASVGIDMEHPALTQNKSLDYLINGSIDTLPFKDETFDIIVCKDVLEHLKNPSIVFQEFSRVLKYNGLLSVSTPNIYNYVIAISMFTPFRFHKYFKGTIGIKEDDTFRTYYKANSVKALESLGWNAGFKMEFHTMIQKWPSYLIFSVVLFREGSCMKGF